MGDTDFLAVEMETLAAVTRQERSIFGPGGRSCFIEFTNATNAKIAIAELLLAGLTFTVAGFFEMLPSHKAEVFFGLPTINHDVYLTPEGDALEAAFIAYAESLGGTYTGS